MRMLVIALAVVVVAGCASTKHYRLEPGECLVLAGNDEWVMAIGTECEVRKVYTR